jgi:hypothetical protein
VRPAFPGSIEGWQQPWQHHNAGPASAVAVAVRLRHGHFEVPDLSTFEGTPRVDSCAPAGFVKSFFSILAAHDAQGPRPSTGCISIVQMAHECPATSATKIS